MNTTNDNTKTYNKDSEFKRLKEWNIPKSEGADRGTSVILYSYGDSVGIKLRSYSKSKTTGKIFDEDKVNLTTPYQIDMLVELLNTIKTELN